MEVDPSFSQVFQAEAAKVALIGSCHQLGLVLHRCPQAVTLWTTHVNVGELCQLLTAQHVQKLGVHPTTHYWLVGPL